MNKVILVTGGGRSGKSSYALALASPFKKKAFIATAQPLDNEMKARIARHKKDRDPSYTTIEESTDLAAALAKIPRGTQVAVIDCLTVWLGNLVCASKPVRGEYAEVTRFLHALKSPPCTLVIVSNEVGMGIIPANKLARQFRDHAGMLNQQVAHAADEVIFMVSGYPVTVKKGKDK